MNRDNLTKLADYLESLPEDYKDFGMAGYLHVFDARKAAEYAQHNGGVAKCGTAACAIGHGPAAGILFPEPTADSIFWNNTTVPLYTKDDLEFPVDWVEACAPDWGEYSYEFFIDGEGDEAPEWAWCFGGSWAQIDDHHWGAAARIRYLLAGNEPPKVQTVRGVEIPFIDDAASEEHVALYDRFRKTA